MRIVLSWENWLCEKKERERKKVSSKCEKIYVFYRAKWWKSLGCKDYKN